jgi:hypothetical protein
MGRMSQQDPIDHKRNVHTMENMGAMKKEKMTLLMFTEIPPIK